MVLIPTCLKFNFLYSIELPTLIKLYRNIDRLIKRNGETRVSSAIKFAIQGDATKTTIVQIAPRIMLKVNAVDTWDSELSFFCIIADPKPASDRLIHIAITAEIAAKYPKSAFVSNLDIIAKYNNSRTPITKVITVCVDIPLNNI